MSRVSALHRAAAVLALALLAAPARAEAPHALPQLWQVPKFEFVDQDGRAFTDHSLRGRIWIADYIYTQCTAACPVLTAQMKMLQRKLAGHEVSFLSFSVDPAHDTPAALKAYAAKWHADESHWTLLATGDAARLRALVDGMQTDLSHGPDQAIAHSENFVLIDGQGFVRGRYDSTSPEELAQLVRDAAALAGTSSAPAPAAAESGHELFGSLGCAACHAQPAVAPSLDGVAGSEVTLVGNTRVRADGAYLRESILDPSAKIVAGYMGTMPSYRGFLSDAQVEALVAYLQTLNGAPSAVAGRTLDVDPVCGMKISAGPETPHLRHGGRDYHFCSEACRARFERDPARYLTPGASSPKPTTRD